MNYYLSLSKDELLDFLLKNKNPNRFIEKISTRKNHSPEMVNLKVKHFFVSDKIKEELLLKKEVLNTFLHSFIEKYLYSIEIEVIPYLEENVLVDYESKLIDVDEDFNVSNFSFLENELNILLNNLLGEYKLFEIEKCNFFHFIDKNLKKIFFDFFFQMIINYKKHLILIEKDRIFSGFYIDNYSSKFINLINLIDSSLFDCYDDEEIFVVET